MNVLTKINGTFKCRQVAWKRISLIRNICKKKVGYDQLRLFLN